MAVNQLKAGAILSYISIGLNNIIGLLYTPFMLRMLGQSEYGLYSLAASLIAYLTILDLGFGHAVVRYTAKYRAEGKLREQYELFGMFIVLYCIISLISIGLGIILYINVQNLFDTTMTVNEIRQTRIMILLLILNLAFTFPMSIWGGIITAYENFIFQKIVNIVRIVLNPLVMVVLLFMGYKAITMVVVLTIFNILTLVSNAWFCRYKLKIKVIYKKFDFKLLREIAIFSFWIFLATIVDRVYWNAGQFIIGIYIDTVAIALFSLAIQIQSFYSSFSFAISGVFLPKIVKMINNSKDMEEVSNLFIRLGRIQFYIMSFVFCGFILFGRKFIDIWAGDDYSQTYILSLIFLCAVLFTSIQTVGYSILQARNELKFRSLLLFFTALVSLGISIPVTKYYGTIGCSIVYGLGILIGHVIILNIYYQKKIGLNIKKFWLNIIKIATIPIILTIISHFVLNIFEPQSITSYLISILIFSIVFISLSIRFCFNKYEYSTLVQPVLKMIKR